MLKVDTGNKSVNNAKWMLREWDLVGKLEKVCGSTLRRAHQNELGP